MTDWVGGMESRNHDVTRATDSRNLAELLRTVLFLAVVAGVLTFYLWARGQIIHIGYQNQQVVAEEKSLLREQGHLLLEEQTLKNPERIDAIARNLGMVPIRANQLILLTTVNEALKGSNMLALANIPRPPEPTTPAAAK